jgi:hypothetical protein
LRGTNPISASVIGGTSRSQIFIGVIPRTNKR